MGLENSDRDGNRAGERRGKNRVLGLRWMLYLTVLLLLLLFRFLPGLRDQVKRLPDPRHEVAALVLAGMDLAPGLITKVVERYKVLYPGVSFRIERGGTRHALEELLNRKADIAFLSRPLTADEEAVVRAVGDSAMTTYPVALGAIAILVARDAPLDSIRMEDLRRIVVGEKLRATEELWAGPFHLYAPDPNLGLWTSLCTQLEIPDTAGTSVFWLEDDAGVGDAVGRDPHGLGFASTLALPADLEPIGVRSVAVVGSRSAPASRATVGAIAMGEYPLFHYLYVACRADCGAAAAGFVSFLSSGRGQRLIEREGFLPAREVPREVQLTSQPVGKAG